MGQKILPGDIDPAEKWLVQSLYGDIADSIQPSDVSIKIKDKLFDKIEKAIYKTAQTKPPFQPELLFGKFDNIIFSVEEIESQENIQGFLLPIKNGFKIQVNPKLHSFRKRLVIAHELGHAFFYDWKSEIPSIRFSNSKYWVQEGYALEIARLILIPKFSILEVINSLELKPSLLSLKILRNLYQVSYEVLLRRIMHDLHLWDCLIFISQLQNDTITTNSVNVFKGKSYRSLKIPKSITNELDYYKSLFQFIYSGKFNTDNRKCKIIIGESKYQIESNIIKSDKQEVIISLIKNDSN